MPLRRTVDRKPSDGPAVMMMSMKLKPSFSTPVSYTHLITYIGLGLSVETPSLGNLINDGRKVMMQAGLRYQLLYPCLLYTS